MPFPRFPVLQFGAEFSIPAFSDPAFLTVPRFPVSRFQSPCEMYLDILNRFGVDHEV